MHEILVFDTRVSLLEIKGKVCCGCLNDRLVDSEFLVFNTKDSRFFYLLGLTSCFDSWCQTSRISS